MGKKVVCWMLVFLFLFAMAGCRLFTDDSPDTGDDIIEEGHGGSDGNTETPEAEPEIPADFVKESGENMFWESGDTSSESGVLQNPNLYIYNYAPSVMQVSCPLSSTMLFHCRAYSAAQAIRSGLSFPPKRRNSPS